MKISGSAHEVTEPVDILYILVGWDIPETGLPAYSRIKHIAEATFFNF